MLTFPEHLIPQVFGLDSCCSFTFSLGVTCVAGTAYIITLPWHLSSSPIFNRDLYACCPILSFPCRSFLFVLFLLDIVLSILQFTASDCPFRIFKNFSVQYNVFVNCVCPYPFLPWFCLFPLN